MIHSRCSTNIIFYTAWIAISVVQAIFTELFHDEAYYWMYSNNLAWGYFDHPPAIALFIKIGYSIFNNELGVRLFVILLNTGTIYLIQQIIQPKNLWLYYAIIASVVLIHYGGVLAVPDIPLLFFTASFLFLYKTYEKKPDWRLMVLLGINAGFLLLSKYHGILVIGFTLLSNLKLLKKPSTWLGILLAFLIFSPHILWQYNHDFATIKYHLFSREISPFDYTYVLEFIFTQPLIYGPIIGFVLLFFAFKIKPENDFERALKFIFIGVFVLFFISTFKGKVEAHWTDITFVSIIYFGYKGISQSPKLRKFVYTTLPVSLFLIFAVRIFLMVDFIPQKWHVKTEFHGWDKWAEEIKEIAGERPVVFANSYQNAAKYEFYSGITSISLNDEKGRKNQYTTWKSEDKLQGLPVMYLPNYTADGVDILPTAAGKFNYILIDDFKTYPNIKIITDRQPVQGIFGEPMGFEIEFEKGSRLPEDENVYLNVAFFNIHNELTTYRTDLVVSNNMIKNHPAQVVSVFPADTGDFAVYFSLSNKKFLPTVHSYRTKVSVD